MTDFGHKVVTALRWSVAARIVTPLLSWAMTIVVIRLLSPADYGLVAIGAILPSALYLINDLGLDIVLVQKQAPGETFRRQVFGVVIVINLFCVLILNLAAPHVATFFGEPKLAAIIRVLSLQFILCIFETLPRAKLEQRLDFRSQSMISVVAAGSSGLTTLVLALAGMSVWSLVFGRLAHLGVMTLGLNLLSPALCWPSFSLASLRSSLSFGSMVTLERAAWHIFNDADRVIGGKLLGDTTLGLYVVAQDLATMPMHRTGGFISSIGVPAFAQVQDRLDEVRFYLLKVTRLISTVSFPLFIGLATTAPEAVALLLGPKWSAATRILQVLVLIMPLRMVATLLPAMLWGIARPGVSAANAWIAAVVIPAACLLGAQWGALGMAMAWLVAYPLVWIVTAHLCARAVELRVWDLGRAMCWPALASAIMAAAVMIARHLVPDGVGAAHALAILVPVGVFTYLAVLFVIRPSSIRETLALFAR